MVDRLHQWGARVTAFDSLAALQEWANTRSRAVPAQLAPGLTEHAPARQSETAQPAAGPDMLITDQRLPDGTGLAALALLRQQHPSLPGLVVTGNTSASDLAVLADSGLPVLHKPFRASALLEAINAAIAVPDADQANGALP
jgi:CheY-like chemotaxis protein